ncbi:hypothetical protein [Sphingomonas sp. RS2018]
MIERETTDSHQPTGHAVAADRAVVEDMLAIFGPGTRGTTAIAVADTSTEAAPGHSRAKILAVVSVMLTATIAAGTFLGADVIGIQAPLAASDSHSRSQPPVRSQPGSTAVAAATDSIMESPAQPERSAPLAERPEPVRARAQTIQQADRRPAPVSQPIPRVDIPPPVIVARVEAPEMVRHEIVEPDPFPPVQIAERRAAHAYEVAATVGVRPRLLRDYRLELERARGEAIARPGYAERIFGMIAADLSQLADEAEDRRSNLAR